MTAGVSTHAPAKGATRSIVSVQARACCFNSRPREGGDTKPVFLSMNALVSTHAPAKGATRRYGESAGRAEKVSTHAPAKGATANVGGHYTPRASFNSRPREGGDLGWATRSALKLVSTHAPAKGATTTRHLIDSRMVFQLTPPRRGRPAMDTVEVEEMAVSTHAPAKGATSRPVNPTWSDYCFNSRPREGGDVKKT